MRKRLFSILLVFCMMLSFVPMMASAIEIYIDLTIVGQANLTLEVVSGDNIDNIKEKIQEKTGFSPDAQRLFLGEKELENGRTMADYNIHNGSTLSLRLQRKVQLGTDALSKNVNTATAPTVYFGKNQENKPAAWRVIGYDGSGVASAQGDMTLLAAGTMGVVEFDDTGASTKYAPSNLRTAIDALAGKLTAKETDAVQTRTLTSGSYDGENTDCVAGDQVDNAVFWPLSTAEAFAVNQDLRIVDKEHTNWEMYYWWLRSPGNHNIGAAFVRADGEPSTLVEAAAPSYGVRPAFNLNLNSVLFASAAVGGKPDGGLTAVPEYSGNEWKLTLLDSSRSFAVTKKTAVAAPDDTVTLNYKGATTGINEYISAIIADSSGAQYYGRVAQPTAESGTVEIKIPSDLAPGDYTLKVFSEQYNGDDNTDYASNFTDIALTVEKPVDEQFTLAPGGTYYFDLSAMNIPGTANGGNSDGAVSLPDTSLHYVPFTYVGTIEAYKLTSATATTEEYAQREKYPHSLFIADYAVTHKVNWNNLDTASLIFGKNYASGGVDYTLRAPSCGSWFTGSGDSECGTPQSNEWDAVLDKNSGYIQNWNKMYSWGQDTSSYELLYRAGRGYKSARFWNHYYATNSYPLVGFRPVLEVLNADTLGSGGLKVVTLDLGGGTLGNSSEEIQIIVKSSESFAAPASDGLNRPAGDTGSYFMWLGSNGKLYAPGDSVPADVTKLTAQFALSEQFSLAPGGRYYFDLSAMDIPGTVNSNLPDSTLHYVPFTYAGTVDAYSMENETDTAKQPYEHSLFIADYNVKCSLQRETLAEMNLIYGQTYTASNVNYTLRAPSVGDHHRNEGEGSGLAPIDNEWDTIYQKSADYIKNWYKMRSFGQDIGTGNVEGMYLSRGGHFAAQATFWARPTLPERDIGFRPVLEVPNPGTLGADGLKAVTLNLGGGKLGGSSDAIHIIVKNGSKFTAPASGGLTRPAGDTGSYFMWLDGNGNSYEPGGSVPADVTTLTVQWTAPTYAVTLHTNGGTINNGNVTEYTYGVGAALPTDVTRTGYTFKGWYDNEGLTGDPVTAIGNTETGNKEYWAKWEINQYTITYDLAGGTAEGNPDTYTIETRTFTLKNPTKSGYTFTGWSGTGLDGENNMTVTIPTGSTGNRTYTAHWRYNGSGHSYSYYTIKATAGTGGSISPSGNVSVREGRDQTFTITPDKGYAVANVKIDGKSIGAVKSYTFENVRRTHTIEVIFMKANGNPQTGVFVDVATGSYYEDAVDWAVENGITKGTDDTHFSPDGICTRAQAVTFLWRAAGSPEPETRTMPFTDVPAGSYYYDAVLWAVENGITKGTSETMFSPDATCSRAQIVAFLWRSEKSPAAGTANPFADVKSTAYYAGAVLWAVKEDITKGTTNTTFSPDADCTRAQIVTFLWRCKK